MTKEQQDQLDKLKNAYQSALSACSKNTGLNGRKAEANLAYAYVQYANLNNRIGAGPYIMLPKKKYR